MAPQPPYFGYGHPPHYFAQHGYGPYRPTQSNTGRAENVVSIESKTQSIASDGSIVQRAEHIQIGDSLDAN